MSDNSNLPECVVCNPKLDLELHPIALCLECTAESPLEERLIKRDPKVLDRWILQKRREALASI